MAIQVHKIMAIVLISPNCQRLGIKAFQIHIISTRKNIGDIKGPASEASDRI